MRSPTSLAGRGPTARSSHRPRRNNYESDHPEWRTYTFVKVFVRNLPENVTTVEVYSNLIKCGNISQITLHDTRGGQRASTAEVVFKPPPEHPPWRYRAGLKFKRKDGAAAGPIFVNFDFYQPKNFTVDFEIKKKDSDDEETEIVAFNEETTIRGSSLDFGILMDETHMNVLYSVPSRQEYSVRLVLNLKRREMEVHFPVLLDSSNGAKTRSYKFHVALDQVFGMHEIGNADGSATYILHVQNTPWYTRRLEQKINQSHVSDSKRWFEDDMWTRQTDIVAHKDHFAIIDRTPVALRKSLNTIDISRWTTFAFNVAGGPEQHEACDVLRRALKYYNNRILESSSFKINRSSQATAALYWSLLDTQKPLSSSMDLSSDTLQLSFQVRYQLEVCISHGRLSEYEIGKEFLRKLMETPEQKAKQLLVHVDAYGERVFDPMDIFRDIRYQKPVKARRIPGNCAEVYHASITATGLLLDTPSVEISNRVIRRYRNYATHFLRVRFEDDNYRGQTKLYASSNNRMILIFDRVRRALTNGIVVAGRHYDFLAWGNSQLRDHGCYFFAPVDKGPNASSIRAEMGAFDSEKVVAKRAARMGQCFSTTQPIHLRIKPITKDNTIPDIVRNGFTFSDGVGKISPLAAHLVHATLKLSGHVPSCFQFRLGGCKGILSVDPSLRNIDIKVRASQFKFDSTSQELEIIRCSEFWQPFLNRQLILVLSALGVSDNVFIEMQQETIQALEMAMTDDNAALKALRDNVDPNRMTLAMCDLIESGFRQVSEPFVMSLMRLWRAWSLKYLKEKAKIPISNGAFVLGTIDETGILRGHFDSLIPPPVASREEKEKTLPEIFLQITDPQTGKLKIVEGVCILARNPSLHLGDIRVVKAIDVPALHHLRDCVVMAQTGDRDLPSMCSGGDLDGDDYVVAWDEKLLPKKWNAKPFHYRAPPPKTAVGEITVRHLIDFFYDYLQNDFLGRIAHAHLGAADYLDNGIESEECLRLLHLHSMAVDYPKTGVPAILPRELERTEWPHYMEKRGKSYHSYKVLGQLYDKVKLKGFEPCYDHKFDSRILKSMTPSDAAKQQAAFLKHEYDLALQRIMVQHKIRTEFEVWSTFVMDHSKASRDFKFHEEIGQLSRTLKEQFYQAIVEVVGGSTFEHLREFAVAAYQLTANEYETIAAKRAAIPKNEPKPNMPFISFPWVLADTLGKIASSTMVQPTAAASVAVRELNKDQTSPIEGIEQGEVDGDAQVFDSGSSVVSVQAAESDSMEELASATESELVAEESDDGASPVAPKAADFEMLNPFQQAPAKKKRSSDEGSSIVHVSREPSSAGSGVVSIESKEGSGAVSSDLILPSGMHKDPALMTQAERDAIFGTDDDL